MLRTRRDPVLIRTADAALVFRFSVYTVRDYKNDEVISPMLREGQLDLYDLDEGRWARKRFTELRRDGLSVARAGRAIDAERAKCRRLATSIGWNGFER